jgi:hypothetical protein
MSPTGLMGGLRMLERPASDLAAFDFLHPREACSITCMLD